MKNNGCELSVEAGEFYFYCRDVLACSYYYDQHRDQHHCCIYSEGEQDQYCFNETARRETMALIALEDL